MRSTYKCIANFFLPPSAETLGSFMCKKKKHCLFPNRDGGINQIQITDYPPTPRNINHRQKIKCCLVMCWKMLRPHKKKNKNRNKAFIFLTNKARAAQPPLQSRCSSLVLHQGATLSFRCRCSLPLPPPPTPPPPHLPHPPLFSHPSSLGTQTQR